MLRFYLQNLETFIFRVCLDHGISPQNWEKPTLFLFIKNDKLSLKNYRPVSLLPTCEKMFKRLLYRNVFSFLIENDLISQIQSDFKSGDSCISKILSVTLWWWWEAFGLSIWQILASRCDIKFKIKWNIRKFTKDYWRRSCKKYIK